MALIPDEPRDQYRFLGILVLVGGAVLFWLYVYSPRQAELDLREERLSEIKYQNRVTKAKTGGLDRLRAEVSRYERQLRALTRLVPSRARASGMYESVANRSREAGLELLSVSPNPPSADSAGFLHQQWQLAVQGSYHDVGLFLTRMASMDRIVRPSVRRVAVADTAGPGAPDLEVGATLETLMLPSDTAASRRRTASGGSGPRATGRGGSAGE